MTVWKLVATGDSLRTDDKVPPCRLREGMRRDAERWARQGLAFDGVQVNRDESTKDAFIVTGVGYELRMTWRTGYWPVDALGRAAMGEWTEMEIEVSQRPRRLGGQTQHPDGSRHYGQLQR